jgi:hypothetical protein
MTDGSDRGQTVTWRFVLCFLTPRRELVVIASFFGSKDVRPFTILAEFMNKRPPVKKPQTKIQTVKKQIPIKKIASDRIEELVKKHIGNIGEAENAFKSAPP